jgi:hypothetical protein
MSRIARISTISSLLTVGLLVAVAATGAAEEPPEAPVAAAVAPFDHGYLDLYAFYAGAVRVDGGVDYLTLATRRARLDAYLASAATADVTSFTPQQQLAFWVNTYNALTVGLILDNPGLSSIRDLSLGQVWSTRRFRVAGASMTLDDLEHRRARKLADGRVHAVVNCASKGCPPLPLAPLRAEGIDAALDDAARRWVATNAWSRDGDTLQVSRIFDWYSEDFTKWRPEGASSKEAAAVGFLRAFGYTGEPPARVTWQAYDWSLNASGAW